MVLKLTTSNGSINRLKVAPNVGGEYSKKDVANLMKWCARLKKEYDVLDCVVED